MIDSSQWFSSIDENDARIDQFRADIVSLQRRWPVMVVDGDDVTPSPDILVLAGVFDRWENFRVWTKSFGPEHCPATGRNGCPTWFCAVKGNTDLGNEVLKILSRCGEILPADLRPPPHVGQGIPAIHWLLFLERSNRAACDRLLFQSRREARADEAVVAAIGCDLHVLDWSIRAMTDWFAGDEKSAERLGALQDMLRADATVPWWKEIDPGPS